MRAVLCASLIVVLVACGVAASEVNSISVPPAPHRHRWTRPPGSRSSILAKICFNSDPRMHCRTNCTTYAVQPKHCFDTDEGQTFEFNCIPYPSCIDGREYMNTTCAGNFSMGYRAPCNSCQRGRLTTCSGNNVTHYRCPLADWQCRNITGCRKVFEGKLGTCSSVNLGFYNVSVQLPASRKRCSMVRVDQFFNSKCERRGTTAPGAAPSTRRPHHWSPRPSEMQMEFEEKKSMEEQGAVSWHTLPPHSHSHHSHSGAPSSHHHHWTMPPGHHHRHHWAKHLVYYLPANKCQETGADLSVEFTCKSAHHQDEEYPEATPEVMELIKAHMKKEKGERRFLAGHHSAEVEAEPNQ